jgi:glycogen debranching enzyme
MSTTGWDKVEPAVLDGGITLLDGSTFAITDALGEIRGEPQGFFVADRRVVSRLRLRLVDRQLMPLRVVHGDDNDVTVVRRAMPLPEERGLPPLLCSWRVSVQPGSLTVHLLLRNTSAVARPAAWRVRLAGDFADIFAVKESRADDLPSRPGAPSASDGRWQVGGDGLRLVATASPAVRADEDGLAEDLVLQARQTAQRVISLVVWDREGPVGEASADPRDDEVRRAQIWTPSPELRVAVGRSARDLGALRIEDPLTGGDAIAAGAPWFMTLFGRDSLLTSVMTAGWDPSLLGDVLRSLAARQGTVVDRDSEEEPGRILHETRMVAESALFQGARHRYYGSTDATPLFVVALGEAVRQGMHRTVALDLLEAADRALGWIDTYGDLDGDGFVESAPRTSAGLVNQGWKDSWNAVVDGAGALVPPPYALIEVQAYVYAAFAARAYLAEVLGEGPADAWAARAGELRQRIDDAFWLDELRTYAFALGPDKAPLHTSTSNAGHMLWTGAALPHRVAPLTRTLMSRPLRTHWGLRTLASDHPAYDAFGYHLGSVWPHDSALVAWGLARWGAGRAGAEIARALIRTSTHFGGALPELVAGVEVGDVIAGTAPLPFPTACSPQAWSAAAPVLLLRAVLGLEVDLPRREVHLLPAVPEHWLPLTLHQVAVGPLLLSVRVTVDGTTITGLPDDVRVVHRPWFEA